MREHRVPWTAPCGCVPRPWRRFACPQGGVSLAPSVLVLTCYLVGGMVPVFCRDHDPGSVSAFDSATFAFCIWRAAAGRENGACLCGHLVAGRPLSGASCLTHMHTYLCVRCACVCVCTCMCLCVCLCNACVCVCVRALCACARVSVCTRTYVCTCRHVCIYISACACVSMCAHIRLRV